MEALKIFYYDGKDVEFDPSSSAVMVNATMMGKIYGKKVEAFLRNDNTKSFTKHCLESENSSFLGIAEMKDLVNSKKGSGTWMHRVLALKFAAWLDPKFELWVYRTIEEILFGSYRRMENSLKLSAIRKNRIEELKNQLSESPQYMELQHLELEERQANYGRSKENRNQLELFRSGQQ